MEVSVLVRSVLQYNIVKEYDVSMIYTDNLDLANKYDLYYMVPRVYDDITLPDNILINDVGLLNNDKNKVIDYYMNVANSKTLDLYMKYHVKKINLSLEVNLSELKFFRNLQDYPVEVLVYGRVESMLLKSHPLFTKNGYSIKNGSDVYPIMVDGDSHVHIFHSKVIDRFNELDDYLKLGIRYFRIDFLDESEEEIRKVFGKCEKYRRK